MYCIKLEDVLVTLGITVDRYLPQAEHLHQNIYSAHEGLNQKSALPWDAQMHQEKCFSSFIMNDGPYPDYNTFQALHYAAK